jgi:hypothetical protein
MKLPFLVVMLTLLLAAPVSAQETNIASYVQDVFAPGVDPAAGAPMWSNTYQATAAVCNQTPGTIPPTVVNPTQILWDDKDHAGRVCVATLVSTLLPALPTASGYVTTLKRVDTAGQASGRSAASNPFDRLAPPAAPTGVKVR